MIAQKDLAGFRPRLVGHLGELVRLVKPRDGDEDPGLVDGADMIDTGEPFGLVLAVCADLAAVRIGTRRKRRWRSSSN